MNLILSLITAIAGSLTGLLTADGIMSPNLTNLINASIAAGLALFNALKSGGSVTDEMQSALTALQAEYEAIQKDTSTDPVLIGIIAEASNLVSYAIKGYTDASSGAVDPSTLPIPPEVL